LQGASANPHGHATTRPAGWHHNIAEFAAADGEKGVLTELCLTPVLTDLCLTLYNKTSIKIIIFTIKQNTSGSRSG
jgi:hypothetical protein